MKIPGLAKLKGEDDEKGWYDEEFEGSPETIQTDNWRWDVDYEDVLNKYEHQLRNEIQNNKGGWEEREGNTTKMSDEGINETMRDLRGILHKGTALSSNTDQECRMLTNQLCHAYREKMILNYKEFGVDKTNIKMLIMKFTLLVKSIISRSKNDGERKIRAKMFGYSENYKHNEVRADEIAPTYKF